MSSCWFVFSDRTEQYTCMVKYLADVQRKEKSDIFLFGVASLGN